VLTAFAMYAAELERSTIDIIEALGEGLK